MKSFTKICLIICIALICIGGICMCAGAALGSGPREVMEMMDAGSLHIGNLHIGRWNLFFEDDEDYEEVEVKKGILNQKFPASEADNLEIDIRYGEVFLVTGNTDQIEITIDAPERNVYYCKNDDGTIQLEDKTSSKWWRHGIGKNHHVKVTIAIPEGKSFQEVDLSTNAGRAVISDTLTAEEISLNLDAGELTAKNIETSGDLSADVGAGSLQIDRFTAGTLDVSCGMGHVQLSGRLNGDADVECGMGQIDLDLTADEASYNYDVSCGLGDITINGESYTSLGTKKKIDNDSENDIRLDCGLGEINLIIKED